MYKVFLPQFYLKLHHQPNVCWLALATPTLKIPGLGGSPAPPAPHLPSITCADRSCPGRGHSVKNQPGSRKPQAPCYTFSPTGLISAFPDPAITGRLSTIFFFSAAETESWTNRAVICSRSGALTFSTAKTKVALMTVFHTRPTWTRNQQKFLSGK